MAELWTNKTLVFSGGRRAWNCRWYHPIRHCLYRPGEGVTLRGFEYPLDRADLDHLAAGLGVSNVAVAEHQEIVVESGILLVDVVHEEGFTDF